METKGLLLLIIAGLTLMSYLVSIGYERRSSSFNVHHRPLSYSQKSRQPHQHIYYLKTHKTGSTSMFSILAEYCRSHDLLPLLPRRVHINQSPPLQRHQLLLSDDIEKYDMVFNHHIFTPKMFSYLHDDTFCLTILREPFANFISAFIYYRVMWRSSYLVKVKSDDPLMEFMRHQSKYEIDGYKSFTNNRQSMDLGFNISKGFRDIDYIKQFIKQIDRQFQLVLITEYFDESLIILKRFLGWTTKDILYLHKNKGPNLTTTDTVQEHDFTRERVQRKLHAIFSQADIMLYQHFLNKFKQRMSKEVGLSAEVIEFRNILEKVHDYCEHVGDEVKNLDVVEGKWSDGFQLTPYTCKWLNLAEVDITHYFQRRQHTLLHDE